jgi:hypothetical protein
MTLTVRLDASTEAELHRLAAEQQLSVSDYVRAAIADKLARDAKASFWETAQDLVGCWDSGETAMARSHDANLRKRLLARHNRNRLRPPVRPDRQT